MRNLLRAAGAIPAAILVLVVAAVSPAPAGAQSDPASRAIRYMQSQLQPDGSLPGFSAFDGTEFLVIGAAAAGYDPNQLRNGNGQTAIAFLAASGPLASPDAGNTGRLIQAVVAAGGNPRSFGLARENLIAKLTNPSPLGFYHPTTGAFGNGQTATQALAIQGLVSAGVTPAADTVAYLKARQGTDGGFNYTAFANDPAGSDTNSTAYAIMALDAAGDHSADTAAFGWLRTTSQQQPDGGFGYQRGPSDPISTAVVLQLIVAAGQNPNGPTWTVGGKTPYSNLTAAQGAGGAFLGYLGTPDPATTSQALFGLVQQPLPARGVYRAGTGPTDSTTSAVAALRYLQGQQSPATGALPAGFSPFDASEFYVIAAVAGGFDGNRLAACGGPTVIKYLQENAVPATANAGNTGRLIMAAVAAGVDPTTFGSVNLPARLQFFYSPATTATSPAGSYGDGQTATQSLALLAMAALGQSAPAAAVSYLKGLRDTDGGWNYTAAANDPSGSDTNSTAMALQALAATGDHTQDGVALAWLRTQQQSDGGFGYQAGPSDPVSDAVVLQALFATFQDPASTRAGNGWAVGANSPLAYLAIQQLPGGGFPGYTGAADAGTTSQVAVGLERVPFPVRPSASPALLSAAACPSPAPSPTPTPTPTPTHVEAPPLAPLAPNYVPPPLAEVTQSPSPSPSPSASASPTASPATRELIPVQTVRPEPGQAGSSSPGGIPTPLLYVLVAAGAAMVVLLAGGAYMYLRR